MHKSKGDPEVTDPALVLNPFGIVLLLRFEKCDNGDNGDNSTIT